MKVNSNTYLVKIRPFDISDDEIIHTGGGNGDNISFPYSIKELRENLRIIEVEYDINIALWFTPAAAVGRQILSLRYPYHMSDKTISLINGQIINGR